jgi:hypothetical protein
MHLRLTPFLVIRLTHSVMAATCLDFSMAHRAVFSHADLLTAAPDTEPAAAAAAVIDRSISGFARFSRAIPLQSAAALVRNESELGGSLEDRGRALGPSIMDGDAPPRLFPTSSDFEPTDVRRMGPVCVRSSV